MDDTVEHNNPDINWQELSSNYLMDSKVSRPKLCDSNLASNLLQNGTLRQSFNFCGPIIKENRGNEDWRDLL